MPIDGKIADAPAVLLYEFLALHEHARRAAAWIVDAALVRLNHPHQQPNHAPRRVKLGAFLTFGAGELTEEVFIDAAQDVLRAVFFVAQTDGSNEVNQLTETLPVQCGAGLVAAGSRFGLWIDDRRMRAQDLAMARDLRRLDASVMLICQDVADDAGVRSCKRAVEDAVFATMRRRPVRWRMNLNFRSTAVSWDEASKIIKG